MATRLIIAGIIILIVLAFLPAINNILSDTIIPMVQTTLANTSLPMTDFEVSLWRFIPLALLIFSVVAVIVVLIRRQGESKE